MFYAASCVLNNNNNNKIQNKTEYTNSTIRVNKIITKNLQKYPPVFRVIGESKQAGLYINGVGDTEDWSRGNV